MRIHKTKQNILDAMSVAIYKKALPIILLMNNGFGFFKMKKKIRWILLVAGAVVLAVEMFHASPIFAEVPTPKPNVISGFFAMIIGWGVQLFIKLVGQLFIMVVKILMGVITYNDFIYTHIVTVGWEVTRDISNMFFVLILLFIAIATIFSQETYSYKRYLPRLVMMAILINFSKVICGIIIDFAQILTISFANVVTNVGPQTLFLKFGIPQLFSISNLKFETIQDWDVVMSMIFGLILLTIAFIIILVYLLIFILRIVALWILVVLSPLAYLLYTVPLGKAQSYSSEWWQKFSSYVVVGPVLMFFFWLALTTSNKDMELRMGGASAGEGQTIKVGIAAIGDTSSIVRFIVIAALLIIGLAAAQKSGVWGASFAGSAMGWMKKQAMRPVTLGRKLGWGAVKGAGGLAWGTTKLATKGGIELAGKIPGVRGAGEGLSRFGKWTQRTGASMPVVGRAFTAYARRQGMKAQKLEDEAKRVARSYSRVDPRVSKKWYDQINLTKEEKEAKKQFAKMHPEIVGWDFSGRGAHKTTELQKHFVEDIAKDKKVMGDISNDSWARLAEGGVDVTKSSEAVAFLTNKNNKDSLKAVLDAYGRRGGMAAQISTLEGQLTPEELNNVHRMPVYNSPSYTKFMTDEKSDREELAEKSLQLQNTKGMVQRHGEDFFQSDEFANNPDQYVNQDEYGRLSAAEIKIAAGKVEITEGAGEPRVRYMEGGEGAEAIEMRKGVTMGRFAKGGRLLAANFKELGKYIPEGLGGERIEGKLGLKVKGADAVRVAGGLRAMVTEQQGRLDMAKTPDEQRKALREFGYTGEYKDDQLSGLKAEAMRDSDETIKRLSDTAAISSQGLNVVKKKRGLMAAKHEVRGHEEWDAVDPDVEIRQAVWNSLSDKQRETWEKTSKSARGKVGTAKIEEMFADAEAGVVGETSDEKKENQLLAMEARDSVKRLKGIAPKQIEIKLSAEEKELRKEAAGLSDADLQDNLAGARLEMRVFGRGVASGSNYKKQLETIIQENNNIAVKEKERVAKAETDRDAARSFAAEERRSGGDKEGARKWDSVVREEENVIVESTRKIQEAEEKVKQAQTRITEIGLPQREERQRNTKRKLSALEDTQNQRIYTQAQKMPEPELKAQIQKAREEVAEYTDIENSSDQQKKVADSQKKAEDLRSQIAQKKQFIGMSTTEAAGLFEEAKRNGKLRDEARGRGDNWAADNYHQKVLDAQGKLNQKNRDIQKTKEDIEPLLETLVRLDIDSSQNKNRLENSKSLLAQLERVQKERETTATQKRGVDTAKAARFGASVSVAELEAENAEREPVFKKRVARLEKEKSKSVGRAKQYDAVADKAEQNGESDKARSFRARADREKANARRIENEIRGQMVAYERFASTLAVARKQLSQAEANLKATTARAAKGPEGIVARPPKAYAFPNTTGAALRAATAPDLEVAMSRPVREEESEALGGVINSEPEVKEAVKEVVNVAGPDRRNFELAGKVASGKYEDKYQFFMFMRMLKTLSDAISHMSSAERVALGALGEKIHALSVNLGHENSSPAEFRAVLETNGITQEDLKKVLSDISKKMT